LAIGLNNTTQGEGKEQLVKSAKATSATEPVIVTTAHKGVFFGYVPRGETRSDAQTIRLERARMCVYWSADVRGVMGLAATGPVNGCKIGPAVPAITLRGVTSVMEVSEDAAAKWESAPWAR
jgi:hypothetical protein